LCGEPVLSAFNDPYKVMMATALWYIIVYSPQDIAYQLTKMFPVRMMMYTVKALYYPKKIVAGMKHAQHVLPGNILAMIIIACCKGNGSGLLKPVCRLVRGSWQPASTELLAPSLTTKYCIVGCLLLHLIPGDMTYVALVGLFLVMKVGPLFGIPVDLFSPLERLAAPIVLGDPEGDKKDK